MSILVINPFLNYGRHKGNKVVVWDNKIIQVLNVSESEIVLSAIKKRHFELKAESFLNAKRLIAQRILIPIDQSEVVRPKSDSLILGETQFISEQFAPWAALSSHLRLALKRLGLNQFIYVSNFLDPKIVRFVEKRGIKKFSLINPFSETIVISPILRGIADLKALQSSISMTWTCAVYGRKYKPFRAARPNSALGRHFCVELSKMAELRGSKLLGNHILSFGREKKFFRHKVVWELGHNLDLINCSALISEINKTVTVVDTNGGFRTKSISENFDYLIHLVDPITGLADRVEEYEANGNYIFRSYSQLQYLVPEKFVNLYSMGKGSSKRHSFVSCIAELIERALSITNLKNKKMISTSQLVVKNGVMPSSLLFYSKKQYRNRPTKESNVFKRVPLEPVLNKIFWIKGFNLTERKSSWVPQEYCYNLPGRRSKYFVPTSNGVATGSSYSEAILQGIYELIERDAAAIWWYAQCYRKQFRLAGINLKVIERAVRYLNKKNKKVRIIDITSDLGIPCVAAVAYTNGVNGSLRLGFGCHHSMKIAIIRSVTELLQSEIGVEIHTKSPNPEYSSFSFGKRLDDSFLNPKEICDLKIVKFTNQPISYYIEDALKKLSEARMAVHVVNFSIEGFPYKVVKVVIPKLRSMLFELKLGRLASVPRRLGLKSRLNDKQKLNPYCLDI